jgi:hypothetical protein
MQIIKQVLKHWCISVTSLCEGTKAKKAATYVRARATDLMFISIKICQ